MGKLESMALKELEAKYVKLWWIILEEQKGLLAQISARLESPDLKPNLENSANFLDKVIAKSSKILEDVTTSNITQKLKSSTEEFIAIEDELKTRRQDLFATLMDQVDLWSLSDFQEKIDKVRGPKTANNPCIEKANDDEVIDHSRVTAIRVLNNTTDILDTTSIDHFPYLSVRWHNALWAEKIRTYGDIIKFWKENWPAGLLKIRNFWHKSFIEVIKLLEACGINTYPKIKKFVK